MKKIAALICLTALVCAAFASCGKAPEFFAMDEDRVVSLYWETNAVKDIDKEEYFKGFAEAYNSVTETGCYEDEDAIYSFIAACAGDDGLPSVLYRVSYIGEDTFNVTIMGNGAPSEDNAKYSVENVKLKEFMDEKFLTVEKVDVKVDVKFVLAAGTPAEDGGARAEDEIIGEVEQTLEGDEADLPTAFDAVMKTLTLSGITDDYKISGDGKMVVSMNGYKNTEGAVDGEVRLYRWRAFLNGEEISNPDLDAVTVSDGDEIAIKYVASKPGE